MTARWVALDPAWLLPVYVGLGFAISQSLHAWVYRAEDCANLTTWLSPAVEGALLPMSIAWTPTLLSSLLAAGLAMWAVAIAQKAERPRTVIRSLCAGFWLAVLSVLAGQVGFSSGLRLLYEGSLWILLLLHVFTWRGLVQLEGGTVGVLREETAWRVLKLALSVLLALPVVFSGASVIATFYDNPGDFTHRQFYRHFFMAAYFAAGMLWFMVWPLVGLLLRSCAESSAEKRASGQ